jgi:hypothetical protein
MSSLTTIYSCPIITTCESILVIFILFTNFKVVAVVNAILGTILFNLMFLHSTITVVIIILYSKVFSTYAFSALASYLRVRCTNHLLTRSVH